VLLSFFLGVQLSQPYVATGHTSAFISRIYVEIGMLSMTVPCSDAPTACPLYKLLRNSVVHSLVQQATRRNIRAVFDGGVRGLNPPRKFLTPLLLLKNAKGVDFLCTYALARSSTSIAKTSTPPPNEI